MPKEDKDTSQKAQNAAQNKWICSVENGPWYETTIRIVTSYGEHVVVADSGAVFIADVEIVIVNKEKGYTRIWLIK
jgi:hypothetical protein